MTTNTGANGNHSSNMKNDNDKNEQASSESGINPSSSECDSNDDNPVKGNNNFSDFSVKVAT